MQSRVARDGAAWNIVVSGRLGPALDADAHDRCPVSLHVERLVRICWAVKVEVERHVVIVAGLGARHRLRVVVVVLLNPCGQIGKEERAIPVSADGDVQWQHAVTRRRIDVVARSRPERRYHDEKSHAREHCEGADKGNPMLAPQKPHLRISSVAASKTAQRRHPPRPQAPKSTRDYALRLEA
jgi:hypothetical protein